MPLRLKLHVLLCLNTGNHIFYVIQHEESRYQRLQILLNGQHNEDESKCPLVLPRGRLVLGARYGSLPYWQHASCQRISGYDPQRAHHLPPAGMAAVGGSDRLKPVKTGRSGRTVPSLDGTLSFRL